MIAIQLYVHLIDHKRFVKLILLNHLFACLFYFLFCLKAENSPSHKTQPASTCLIEFKGMEDSVNYSAWPTLLKGNHSVLIEEIILAVVYTFWQ